MNLKQLFQFISVEVCDGDCYIQEAQASMGGSPTCLISPHQPAGKACPIAAPVNARQGPARPERNHIITLN